MRHDVQLPLPDVALQRTETSSAIQAQLPRASLPARTDKLFRPLKKRNGEKPNSSPVPSAKPPLPRNRPGILRDPTTGRQLAARQHRLGQQQPRAREDRDRDPLGDAGGHRGLGWRLEHAGYVLMITGESSRDNMPSTGQLSAAPPLGYICSAALTDAWQIQGTQRPCIHRGASNSRQDEVTTGGRRPVSDRGSPCAVPM